MRVAQFAGQSVDDDCHLVAGIVHEQLVARRVVLPHRHGQLERPAAVQVAEAAIAIAVRILGNVLVPQDLQRHMLALHLAVQTGPVRLGAPPVAGFVARLPIQRRFQRAVAHVLRQRPFQTGRRDALERFAHRRRHRVDPQRYRLVPQSMLEPVSQHLADTPHAHPFRRHQTLLRICPKQRT